MKEADEQYYQIKSTLRKKSALQMFQMKISQYVQLCELETYCQAQACANAK